MSRNTPEKSRRTPLVDRATLSEVIGVRVQAISELVTRGMPRAARGRYDLAACVQWYVAYRLDVAGEDLVPDDLVDVNTARATYYAAQEERVRLDIAERLGELMVADDVLELVGRLSQTFVEALEALPGRLALPLEHEAAVEREIRSAREHVARSLRAELDGLDARRRDRRAAAGARGLAVGGGGASAAAGEC